MPTYQGARRTSRSRPVFFNQTSSYPVFPSGACTNPSHGPFCRSPLRFQTYFARGELKQTPLTSLAAISASELFLSIPSRPSQPMNSSYPEFTLEQRAPMTVAARKEYELFLPAPSRSFQPVYNSYPESASEQEQGPPLTRAAISERELFLPPPILPAHSPVSSIENSSTSSFSIPAPCPSPAFSFVGDDSMFVFTPICTAPSIADTHSSISPSCPSPAFSFVGDDSMFVYTPISSAPSIADTRSPTPLSSRSPTFSFAGSDGGSMTSYAPLASGSSSSTDSLPSQTHTRVSTLASRYTSIVERARAARKSRSRPTARTGAVAPSTSPLYTPFAMKYIGRRLVTAYHTDDRASSSDRGVEGVLQEFGQAPWLEVDFLRRENESKWAARRRGSRENKGRA